MKGHVVLRENPDADKGCMTVAVDGLVDAREAQKVAKEMAMVEPGVYFFGAKLWPGVKAKAITTYEFETDEEPEPAKPEEPKSDPAEDAAEAKAKAEPKAEEPKVEPKAEEPKAEEPKVEEPKVEPKAEKPKAEKKSAPKPNIEVLATSEDADKALEETTSSPKLDDDLF